MAVPALADEESAEALTGTSRRCLLTGAVRPKTELLRFVVDPQGHIVPDIAGKLPGRGLWLTAQRAIVAEASSKRVFARAAKAPVVVSEGLEDRVAALLAQRCIDILGLARRSGLAVAGFVRVKEALTAGKAALLVEATDAAADGQEKLAALARSLPRVACLDARELGGAFGREQVMHVALGKGRLADLFIAEARRLQGFRAGVKVEVSDR
ncbi:MAG TPA: RNA-binding protein [Stellaceae bacterium]